MTEASPFRPKKSVALSGVTAGNTALCTVGRTGNDLHYRGYDILEMANVCEFEETASRLLHEKLPNRAELGAYKARLRSLRGLSEGVRTVLEVLPASAHPMDVLRTGASMLGCLEPEPQDHGAAGARAIADRLVACLGSMLTYWYRSEEHTSELQSRLHLVCRLLLEKKKRHITLNLLHHISKQINTIRRVDISIIIVLVDMAAVQLLRT